MSGMKPTRSTGTSPWILDMKQDIIDLKERITSLERMISDNQKDVTGAPSGSITGENTPSQDIADQNKFKVGFAGTFMDSGEFRSDNTVAQELNEATMAIRQTTIAIRGYGMLLDQLGLPKETRKAIKAMEEMAMMALKAANAVRLMQLAVTTTTGPMGWFYAAISGGSMSASMAYGMKYEGSGI